MDGVEIIRSALEKQLNSIPGIPTIHWENIVFKPTLGTPYVRAILNVLDERAASIGVNSQTYYEGALLVDVFFPQGNGPQNADALATLITDTYFEHGTYLTEAGERITIRYSKRSQGQRLDPWYMVPTLISWYAYI